MTEQHEQEQHPQAPTRQRVHDDLEARVERMITDPKGYFAEARAQATPVVKEEIRQRLEAMKRSRKEAGRRKRRQFVERVRDVTRRAVGGHGRSAR
ncbi:MAG TPA: hypothetical protein VF053_13140 [Streptosporangiales bacterium]